MCLLHNHLAENVLKEGALWRLLRLLFEFDICLKSRRQAEPGSIKSHLNTPESQPLIRTRFCFHATQVLPSTSKMQTTNSVAAPTECAEDRPHAIASLPLAASVACAAMSTLTTLLEQSNAAQEAFLLLGGVAVVLSMLAEFQV
jgi:hypothetical protein